MSITTGRGPFHAKYLWEDASGNDMPGGGKKINCLSFAQYHAHKSIILHTRIREKINKYIKK